MTVHWTVRRHWLQAKTNANEGSNSCASIAGLVNFIACFILLVITPLGLISRKHSKSTNYKPPPRITIYANVEVIFVFPGEVFPLQLVPQIHTFISITALRQRKTCNMCDESGKETKLTLQLAEWNGVKVHVTLEKRGFQINSASYPRRRKHARVIRCLQYNKISFNS